MKIPGSVSVFCLLVDESARAKVKTGNLGDNLLGDNTT